MNSLLHWLKRNYQPVMVCWGEATVLAYEDESYHQATTLLTSYYLYEAARKRTKDTGTTSLSR
jgi:hypothetical protein